MFSKIVQIRRKNTATNNEEAAMPINEQAQKNHDRLFPGHASTAAVTDPELVEIFDNWAFDEVLRESHLEIQTRLMVQIAAIIACQAVREYRAMLGAALNVGVTPVEVKEILYQSVPYVGMAKAFDFIQATNEVLTERGIQLPLPGQSTTTPENRAEMGLAVQKQIIGSDAVDRFRASAPADQQHIQRFLAAACFGDYYTRTGIDIPTRELLTLSILVSLGGCDAQVKAHVAANLNVGNDRARLIDVITQLLPFIGYPRTLNALRAVDDVTAGVAKLKSQEEA
jgi:4-carboxymuconolactone decarboxylase